MFLDFYLKYPTPQINRIKDLTTFLRLSYHLGKCLVKQSSSLAYWAALVTVFQQVIVITLTDFLLKIKIWFLKHADAYHFSFKKQEPSSA